MDTDITQRVEARLLSANGLCPADIEGLLAELYGPGVDDADVYCQSRRVEAWTLDDGILKEGSHRLDVGAGLRAISGERTGFAYADELSLDSLRDAALTARAIGRGGDSHRIHIPQSAAVPRLYSPQDPAETLEVNLRLELMRRVEAEARAADPAVQEVSVSLVSSYDHILVASEANGLVADIRPLVRMSVHVIVERSGRREQGSSGGGWRGGFEDFLQNDRALDFAREAVRQALVNLEAEDAPAGPMTVVLGSGWPGVLLHEAVGHGLEGDFNRKGTSVFADRIGESVATSACTVVDDGTMSGRRGSLSVDDEGAQSRCTTLIENGRLTGYLQDRHNARLMGQESTGNGRRESYACLPMPRMTNTYMLPGEYERDEIIASVENGLYAVQFRGGQVDITNGKFVFSASEAYRIENGRITTPVKGATLIGNGPDVLTKVSMVGNDLALDNGIGVCGKEGQSVPVGVGQPTLKVDELTVGGTHG